MQAGKVKIENIHGKAGEIIRKLKLYDPKKELEELLLSGIAEYKFDLKPEQILFLNFNYTSLEKIYRNPLDFEQFEQSGKPKSLINHIHGIIESDDNPMIFGFGDELDEDYKSIENLNENDFLRT